MKEFKKTKPRLVREWMQNSKVKLWMCKHNLKFHIIRESFCFYKPCKPKFLFGWLKWRNEVVVRNLGKKYSVTAYNENILKEFMELDFPVISECVCYLRSSMDEYLLN